MVKVWTIFTELCQKKRAFWHKEAARVENVTNSRRAFPIKTRNKMRGTRGTCGRKASGEKQSSYCISKIPKVRFFRSCKIYS